MTDTTELQPGLVDTPAMPELLVNPPPKPLAPLTERLREQIQKLPTDWRKIVEPQLQQPYMQKLLAFLSSEFQQNKTILPPEPRWLNALQSTPLAEVKVVIIGQDPYPTVGHAHGLCFSVLPGVTPLPKSLLNINKELLSDLEIDNHHTGHLQAWANQGVLLLNAVLTVEAGQTNSHQNQGWELFTDALIEAVHQQGQHCVFLLWGAYAQKKGKALDRTKHLVIESPHPSPLSAYRGFFGSAPFSQANDYLISHSRQPIDWQLPRAL